MTETFFGEVDLASVAIWLFWGFFALLIYYIQRENMREGYPLVDDDGNASANQGPFPVPGDKTFKLPHGRGEVTVPSGQRPDRSDLPLERTSGAQGFPFEPTGDPMIDGVGPASWANRRDLPELDGRGHNKLVPMRKLDAFSVASGRDPRSLPVQSGDDVVVGKVVDMWIDEPEQMVRYVEYELLPEFGGGNRLVPLTLARIRSDRLKIRSIYAEHFANVPTLKSPDEVTMLEEEKICGYYAGGLLYASTSRQDPQL